MSHLPASRAPRRAFLPDQKHSPVQTKYDYTQNTKSNTQTIIYRKHIQQSTTTTTTTTTDNNDNNDNHSNTNNMNTTNEHNDGNNDDEVHDNTICT